MYVYVLDKEGKPLMPTQRCGHVRFLLKNKQAVVASREPFTIRLLYDTPGIVQPLYYSNDPGRTNIGCAVMDTSGNVVFQAQLETRNRDIPKLMASRKASRQAHRKLGRRDVRRRRAVRAHTAIKTGVIERHLPGYKKPVICRDIRNKEVRYSNRKRRDGWLTPTAGHLLRTHVQLFRLVSSFLPVHGIIQELNRFAFMQMEDPGIKKWEFRKGRLYQKDGVKEAVAEQQEGKCLMCGNSIEHYHHIVPRHRNGSDTVGNIAGLCSGCHEKAHTDDKFREALRKKRSGLNKKYGSLSVLNQIFPQLLEELGKERPGNVYAISARDMARAREVYGIPKDHHLDAAAAAAAMIQPDGVNIPDGLPVYKFRQFRRHDRKAIHKENSARHYCLDGKKAATNRNKAFEQKAPALSDIRKELSEQQISKLEVRHVPKQYRKQHEYMPGSLFLDTKHKHIYILQRYNGTYKGRTNYLIDTDDGRHRYTDCRLFRNNTGIVCTGQR